MIKNRVKEPDFYYMEPSRIKERSRPFFYTLVLFAFLVLWNTCQTDRMSVYSDFPELEQEQISQTSFWLGQVEHPDKVILSPSMVEKMNRRNISRNTIKHPLFEDLQVKGKYVRQLITADLEWIGGMKKYNIKDQRLNGKEFIKEMRFKMAMDSIPRNVRVRFGFIVKPSYLRVFPTDEVVLEKPGDFPFDLLQHSFLDMAEPVALYHVSQDREWGYVLSSHTCGWVLLKDVAWTFQKELMREYLEAEPFIIALDWEVPVYEDADLDRLHATVHMGTRLPLLMKDDHLRIRVPVRKEDGKLEFRDAYMKNDRNVSCQYLEMTARNIARQSFRMLDLPYAWGGRDYQTDCSYFINVVFKTMGLMLPRNSGGQIVSIENHRVPKKNKKEFFSRLVPFQTLLFLPRPDHIMLYIGENEGHYYVIHNKWSYKKRVGGDEKEVLVKKILVSHLQMGRDSRDGSLFDRISRIGVLR
ncbi:MAG: SH3 domain-containing protein [bacterium]|nr:SH3 domain-containing protein [bacterium]